MFRSVIKTPEIEFYCEEEDYGIIPEPYPSRKYLPDWYKALPPKINNLNKLQNSTIKRCPPFLDAMCIGWIIPLAANVEFITNEDASGLSYKSDFYKPMVENHGYGQVTTDECPNPNMPKPPMKFLNYWYIKVPKDWSVLFVPPINRPDSRFTCISGMVDCDNYNEYINFPFFFNTPNYTGIVKSGTPLVQIIPMKRSDIMKQQTVRKINKKDKERINTQRKKRMCNESLYRDKVWTRK